MGDTKSASPGLGLQLSRLQHIIYVLLKHASGHCADRLFGRWPGISAFLSISHLSGPERLRLVIEDMGGTFIKFGQVMALQPDVLSPEYCNALFALLDEVKAFDFKDVERTFLQDLGRSPLEIFDSFNPQPFATGSIGQVHSAVLAGQRVAVKVRRPTVEKDFAVDLRLIAALVKVIECGHIRKLSWLIQPLTEFVCWTSEELDYRREASYMDELWSNSRDNPREHVPEVFWDYTTERILTAEYFEAVTVLDYIRATGADSQKAETPSAVPPSFDPNCFARNIIHNYIGDALRYGIFHADPHPANLMIMPASEVGYIDFGIVGMLNPYSRYYLIEMTLAYTGGDLSGLCAAFFKISEIDENSDPERFRKELSTLAGQWYTPGPDQHLRKSITMVMLDLLNLSRATAIWPRRDVIRYIRSAIVLDGLIKNFAPKIDLGRSLEEVCEQHYLWYELQDLISSDKRISRCLVFLPKEQRELAQQELENLREAIQHFGRIDSTPEVDPFGRPSLSENIQSVAQMDRFDSLWATEGLGYRVAEAALKINQCPVELLSCQKFLPLPASSLAAIHVGVSLSVSKRLLRMANQPGSSFSLSDAITTFFQRCESRAPAGCDGVAVEALGLVVRTLTPQWLLEVDRELQAIDPNLVGYFWHGVGRGLYFIFPPTLYSRGSHSIAIEKAWQDPPHEVGRVNSLAGLAWPLTLVNIRHPQILAAFLSRYGAEVSHNGAFSSGIATSILLWLAWAGHDQYLDAFTRYQPEHTTLSDAATWSRLVREPCFEVMKCHHPEMERTKRYGELFRYQPLSVLAKKLNSDKQAVRAAASGQRETFDGWQRRPSSHLPKQERNQAQ